MEQQKNKYNLHRLLKATREGEAKGYIRKGLDPVLYYYGNNNEKLAQKVVDFLNKKDE